jgi:hypothetical protein
MFLAQKWTLYTHVPLSELSAVKPGETNVVFKIKKCSMKNDIVLLFFVQRID